MRKIVTPDSWDFNEPTMVQVPVLRTQKLGSFDQAQLEKRMSSNMLSEFKKLALHPGEVPVHIVAVGSTEFYGPNRNGDGFPEAVCREYHPSFIKSARFFRGHKSTPKDPFYGTVKLSSYNEDMHRIELLAALFATKEAAATFGPRARVADLEMQKLANEDPISTSMGCAVSHDICSHCGKKSRNPKEYCTAANCPTGGLKKNMGKVCADGSVLHAINPDPDFNDISHVKRGADRISFIMGALRKTASEQALISGAELAELTYIPEYETKLSIAARELSLIESQTHKFAKLAAGCSAVGREKTFFTPEEIRDDRKLVQACAALADQDIILPVEEFVELLTGQKQASAAVRAELPGVFERLQCPLVNPFTCYEPVPTRYRAWAEELAPSYSLEKTAVARRIGIASLRGLDVPSAPQQKRAGANALAEEAAQQYALYVLASLDRTARHNNLGLTATLSLLQNQI